MLDQPGLELTLPEDAESALELHDMVGVAAGDREFGLRVDADEFVEDVDTQHQRELHGEVPVAPLGQWPAAPEPEEDTHGDESNAGGHRQVPGDDGRGCAGGAQRERTDIAEFRADCPDGQ